MGGNGHGFPKNVDCQVPASNQRLKITSLVSVTDFPEVTIGIKFPGQGQVINEIHNFDF